MDRSVVETKLFAVACSVGLFLLGLLAAEILLAVLAPIPDPYLPYKSERWVNPFIRSEFPPHYRARIEVEEGLPGVRGRHDFTTNNMGFRGDFLRIPKPPDEFRLFMIGGSSTAGWLLDDSEAVTAVLQRALQARAASGLSVKVYNAGKSGDASDDHISMLVHRIVHLEPDMAVIFAGFNDLTRSIHGYDHLHYTERKKEKYPLLRFAVTEFQLGRRFYHITRPLLISDREVQETIPLKTSVKQSIRLQRAAPEADTSPRFDVRPFTRNLVTLVGVARSQGFPTVLMTHQTTWNSTVDPQAKNWHYHRYRGGVTYGEAAVDSALEAFNQAIREVGRQFQVPVFDLTRHVPKSTEYFYDDVHFNVKGARHVGEALARFIAREGLIPGLLPDADAAVTTSGHRSPGLAGLAELHQRSARVRRVARLGQPRPSRTVGV